MRINQRTTFKGILERASQERFMYVHFRSCVQWDMETIIWFIMAHKRKFKFTILIGKNCILLNSVQEFIDTEA